MNQILNRYLPFWWKAPIFVYFGHFVGNFWALFLFDQYQWFPDYWIELCFELNHQKLFLIEYNRLHWILGKQYWVKCWIESFPAEFNYLIESDRVSPTPPFAASSWKMDCKCLSLGKKLCWMPGTWALWMRKSWCWCTHVHVVPVDAVTFLHSGTPILCTRPVDRWIHFRTHSSTSPTYLSHVSALLQWC